MGGAESDVSFHGNLHFLRGGALHPRCNVPDTSQVKVCTNSHRYAPYQSDLVFHLSPDGKKFRKACKVVHDHSEKVGVCVVCGMCVVLCVCGVCVCVYVCVWYVCGIVCMCSVFVCVLCSVCRLYVCGIVCMWCVMCVLCSVCRLYVCGIVCMCGVCVCCVLCAGSMCVYLLCMHMC